MLLPQPPRVFSLRGLRLYFPALEPWVARSALLPLQFLPVYLCVNVGLQGLPATTLWGLLAAAWPAHSTIRHLTGSTSHHLAANSLCPGCPSPPLLPVWINVSSLSPWLLDFHTVRFSVSSRCLLFLNCCCPFGCAKRHSVSTYASILARSLPILFFILFFRFHI